MTIKVKRTSLLKFFITLFIIFIIISTQIIDYSAFNILYLGYTISIIAILISFIRGGFGGFCFWITLIASYPIITPFIVQDLFGFPYISFKARYYQEPELLAEPIFIASLVALILSIQLRKNFNNTIEHREINSRIETSKFLYLCAVPMLFFFAWLTEPGSIIGVVNYSTLRQQRITGTNFAALAWVAVAALITGMFIKKYKDSKEYFLKILFYISILFSIVYLLLHARRSEISGFMIFYLCLLYNPAELKRRISSLWHLKLLRYLVISIFMISASLIGYYRNTLEYNFFKEDYFHVPGGTGNNILTFITGYHIAQDDGFPIFSGETYLGHIQRLPPSFLQLERWPDANDVLESIVPLTGSQYYLLEPMMNFGIIGIIFYALIYITLCNLSIKCAFEFFKNQTGMLKYLLSASFLILIFRTTWYGPSALIKATIICVLLFFMLSFLNIITRKRI